MKSPCDRVIAELVALHMFPFCFLNNTFILSSVSAYDVSRRLVSTFWVASSAMQSSQFLYVWESTDSIVCTRKGI